MRRWFTSSAALYAAAQGHFWTIWPHVAARPVVHANACRPFLVESADSRFGSVRTTGWFAERVGATGALVVMHGLGGSVDSAYMGRAARAAARAGLSCLLLNMRGADRTGEDLYHAGLTTDLHAALEHPDLASYRSLYLLGYSLGGHVALRASTEALDQRVRAVAAICSPLDLRISAAAIDEPERWAYRRHVMAGLMQTYAAYAKRRGLEHTLERISGIRSIREWDGAVVVPHFGWQSVDEYYEAASVAPRLGELRLPALYVGARFDPMVPHATVSQVIRDASSRLEARFVAAGGHVGFPMGCDLGASGERGLEAQVISWLLAR
jgi:hypothetical protein